MGELRTTDEIERALRETATVAVLGAHDRPEKAAYYVPEYLDSVGYTIIPVNPVKVHLNLFGEPVRASLAEIDVSVDMVDIFRRGELLDQHLDDILAMNPLPKVVWFQQGIRNDGVAGKLIDAGIDVVQDRCTLADHRALGIPSKG